MHKRMAMGMKDGGMGNQIGRGARGAGPDIGRRPKSRRNPTVEQQAPKRGRAAPSRAARGMRAGGMGGRTGDMMYSRGYGVGERSKRMPTMLQDRGAMKKGGVAKKKKKPMKGRMASPAKRITGTRPNRPINPTNPGFPYIPRPMQKMQKGGKVEMPKDKGNPHKMKKGGLKPVDRSKNPGLAKLPTGVRNKMGYMKKGGRTNTRRMNRLEELGRVDAEKAYSKKGKRNLKSEKKRIVRELKK